MRLFKIILGLFVGVAAYGQVFNFDASRLPNDVIGVGVAHNDIASKGTNGFAFYAHKVTDAGTYAYTRVDMAAGQTVTSAGASEYVGTLFGKVSCLVNGNAGPAFTRGRASDQVISSAPVTPTVNAIDSITLAWQAGGDCFAGKKDWSIGIGGARLFQKNADGFMLRMSFTFNNLKFK